MSAVKEDDTLSEMRKEYRQTKKELDDYDRFIDNHPLACIFIPFFLSLCLCVTAVVISSGWIGLVALLLFLVSAVMLTILIARSNKVSRINTKLDDIEHEVKLFHTKNAGANFIKTHSDDSSDELELWRDIEQDTNDTHSNKGGWIMLIIVIVAVATVGSMIQANKRSQEATERAKQTQIIQQQEAKQQQDAIEQRKLDQQDEANRLQQQQNAIDLYKNTKSDSSDYRSSTSCTSRAIGSTVYTDCD